VKSADLEVQGRYEINPKWPKASVMSAFALKGSALGDKTLLFENVAGQATVTWDGATILAEYPSIFNDDVLSAHFDRTISDHMRARNQQGYLFLFPNGITLAVLRFASEYIDLSITLPHSVGPVTGHCGSFTADTDRDGVKHAVAREDSMFATTIQAKASPNLDISDCDEESLTLAREICDGMDTDDHYEACVFDVCITGDTGLAGDELAMEEMAGGWMAYNLVDKDTKVKSGNYLGKVEGLEQFDLTMEITPHSKKEDWQSIVHFTDGPEYKDCCDEGDRVPAVWFFPGTTRLRVRMSRKFRGNDGCDPEEELPLDRKSRVQIRVQYPYLLVFINDKVACVAGNYGVGYKPSNRVAVMMGNSWNDAADVTVHKMVYHKARPLPTGELIGPEPVKLEKGQLLGKFSTLEAFKLSFDIKPTGSLPEEAGILHFTQGLDRNSGQEGDRIPAIWFQADGTKLSVHMSRQGAANDGCDPEEALEVGVLTTVVVELSTNVLKISFNGKEVCRNDQYDARHPAEEEAFVYTADPWHPAALAELSNVLYEASKDMPEGMFIKDPVALTKGTFLGTTRGGKNWEVSFYITPTGAQETLSNIVHFTADPTRNCCENGDRIPAVFFHPRGTRLHVRVGKEGNGNSGCDPRRPLSKNIETKITIRVENDELVVMYGDSRQCKVSFVDAFEPEDLITVYGGDPWHEAALATVRELTYKRL